MTQTIFPNFQWDGYCWTTWANLPAWTGFQIRNGPYGAISSSEKSSGMHKIVFAPEGRGEQPLTASEIALVQWVVDHQKEIHDSVLGLLFTAYPALKQAYLEDYDLDYSENLPEIAGPDDVKSLAGIVAINVHQVSKDGLPYIGVELGCNWDEDHGAGVLLHGAKPIEVGGADTAILLWMAKKHAGQS